ncbi:MAG: hypothetical protein FGM40_06665 [Rhodocyclaceae bacterium]|nr:hypothetical protein [Rhodocyclaceae bacterium]
MRSYCKFVDPGTAPRAARHPRATAALLSAAPAPRGSVLLLSVVLLPVLVGLVALAADIARILLTKDELRRAAEAAALAGAKGLLTSTTPDWSAAGLRARDALTRNNAAGTALQDAVIEYGYWDLGTQGWGAASSFSAGLARPTGGQWAPALRVTVGRDGSATGTANGGPLSLFFAPVFGSLLQNVSASAIAMQSAPGRVEPQALLPIAINRCMFDLYWNSSTGAPIPVAPTSPYYNAADPYELRIGAQNQYGTCAAGQWNLFSTTDNSTAGVQGLLTNGNPSAMSIGDQTWIDSGVKNALYDSVPVNKAYLVAVVDDLSKGWQTIRAFAPFYVTKSVGGNTKTVFGRFMSASDFPGALDPGGTTYYGVPAPPALVR